MAPPVVVVVVSPLPLLRLGVAAVLAAAPDFAPRLDLVATGEYDPAADAWQLRPPVTVLHGRVRVVWDASGMTYNGKEQP